MKQSLFYNGHWVDDYEAEDMDNMKELLGLPDQEMRVFQYPSDLPLPCYIDENFTAIALSPILVEGGVGGGDVSAEIILYRQTPAGLSMDAQIASLNILLLANSLPEQRIQITDEDILDINMWILNGAIPSVPGTEVP